MVEGNFPNKSLLGYTTTFLMFFLIITTCVLGVRELRDAAIDFYPENSREWPRPVPPFSAASSSALVFASREEPRVESALALSLFSRFRVSIGR